MTLRASCRDRRPRPPLAGDEADHTLCPSRLDHVVSCRELIRVLGPHFAVLASAVATVALIIVVVVATARSTTPEPIGPAVPPETTTPTSSDPNPSSEPPSSPPNSSEQPPSTR